MRGSVTQHLPEEKIPQESLIFFRVVLMDRMSGTIDGHQPALRNKLGNLSQFLLRNMTGRSPTNDQGRSSNLGQVVPPRGIRSVELTNDWFNQLPVERNRFLRIIWRIVVRIC